MSWQRLVPSMKCLVMKSPISISTICAVRDARPLKECFYHNAMDVVAMAALLSHVTAMLEDPFGEMVEHGLDVVALAKLFEDLGEWDGQHALFERGLEMELPEADFWLAIQRLSRLQKRRGDLETAVHLWERAGRSGPRVRPCGTGEISRTPAPTIMRGA